MKQYTDLLLALPFVGFGLFLFALSVSTLLASVLFSATFLVTLIAAFVLFGKEQPVTL